MQPAIGIFGGTFDPVHFGHIGVAEFVLEHLSLKEIRFIPVFNPHYREKPTASFEDRVAMLKIACEMRHPNFIIDDREKNLEGFSYTINTLKSLKKDFPKTPFCLIMGMDQFAHIETWHQWQDLLNICHFVLINRPDMPVKLSSESKNLLKQQETKNKEDLENYLNGKIIQLKMPPIPISATKIREKLKQHQHSMACEIPADVLEYIKEHNLYKF